MMQEMEVQQGSAAQNSSQSLAESSTLDKQEETKLTETPTQNLAKPTQVYTRGNCPYLKRNRKTKPVIQEPEQTPKPLVNAATKNNTTANEEQLTQNFAENLQTVNLHTTNEILIAEPNRTNEFPVISAQHNIVENDRQRNTLNAQDAIANESVVASQNIDSLLGNGVSNSFLSYISSSLGLPCVMEQATPAIVKEYTPAERATETRKLKVQLSMNDPTLESRHCTAHQLLVSGAPLQSLRAAGVNAADLRQIGISFADWVRFGFNVQELVFMGAEWKDIVAMGFSAEHIVQNRDKSGPSVLAAPPLNVTFGNLQDHIGMSIDDAIFDFGFTTADFAVLGETINTLVQRGFNQSHVQFLAEPPYNYTIALQADARELKALGIEQDNEDRTKTERNFATERGFIELNNSTAQTEKTKRTRPVRNVSKNFQL